MVGLWVQGVQVVQVDNLYFAIFFCWIVILKDFISPRALIQEKSHATEVPLGQRHHENLPPAALMVTQALFPSRKEEACWVALKHL